MITVVGLVTVVSQCPQSSVSGTLYVYVWIRLCVLVLYHCVVLSDIKIIQMTVLTAHIYSRLRC